MIKSQISNPKFQANPLEQNFECKTKDLGFGKLDIGIGDLMLEEVLSVKNLLFSLLFHLQS